MAPILMSPRVPGVGILAPNATGPQYARWRRGVKTAFTARGTWGHCDGSVPMPMPESGPSFFTPSTSSNPQPGLLEERRAWVKKDRDVKLDLFLSVADDIKLEIFEVGPPLPPSAMTALEMIGALDERYHAFKFEDYHHIFCHFLNLHIDQYDNLGDFNKEFQATLNDLLDHGAPMLNMQACSAYFSKLRCTQNPWVAKKLKDWGSTEETPLLKDLMKECPPWIIIRPLATKSTTQQLTTDFVHDESLEDNHGHSFSLDGEAVSDRSEVSTISSQSSHSRQTSNTSQGSQEITVHASFEDLTELTDSFPMPSTKILVATPKLNPKASISKMASLPPINRPLPPLPGEACTSSRSESPSPPRLETTFRVHPTSTPSARPQTSTNQVYPALRPITSSPAHQPSNSHVHPRQQARTPTPPLSSQPHITSVMRATSPSPPLPSANFSPKNLASRASRASTWSPPLPQFAFSSSPDLDLTSPSPPKRPSSSRSMVVPEFSGMDTFSSYLPTKSPLRFEPGNGSLGAHPATTAEYHDTLITEHGPAPSNLLMSTSPPRTIISRLSAEAADDEKRSRKRSWSIKARLSARRHEVREMI